MSLIEIRCIRWFYSSIFYFCLSSLALIRQNPKRPDHQDVLKDVATYKRKLVQISAVNDVNYAAWIHILEAELLDVDGTWPAAGLSYEAAIDHAQEHGFAFEEAQAYELYGAALARQGAKRLAERMFQDCIATYRRISAFGKCEQVKQLHLSDMQHALVTSSADAATQTYVTDTGNMTFGLRPKEDQSQ